MSEEPYKHLTVSSWGTVNKKLTNLKANTKNYGQITLNPIQTLIKAISPVAVAHGELLRNVLCMTDFSKVKLSHHGIEGQGIIIITSYGVSYGVMGIIFATVWVLWLITWVNFSRVDEIYVTNQYLIFIVWKEPKLPCLILNYLRRQECLKDSTGNTWIAGPRVALRGNGKK